MIVNKSYDVFVQFDPINVKVKARNQREAKRRAIDKVKAMSAHKVMDKRNVFVDESR